MPGAPGQGACRGPRQSAGHRAGRWRRTFLPQRRSGGGQRLCLPLPPPRGRDPGFVSSPAGQHASPEKAGRVLWPRGLGYLRIMLGEGHRVESLHAGLYVLST